MTLRFSFVVPQLCRSFAPALLAVSVPALAATNNWRVEIPATSNGAGGFDRILAVSIPSEAIAKPLQFASPTGELVSWQFDLDRNDQVLLKLPVDSPLAKGGRVNLTLAGRYVPGPSTFTFTTNDHRIGIASNGREWAGFQAEPGTLPRPDIKPLFIRGGYIHPLLTPAGRLVSDDFAPNHVHHHGVWFSWTKTEFEGRHPDFWNMGDGKGKVEFKSLDGMNHAAVFAGFRSSQQYLDLMAGPPKPALDERWQALFFERSAKSEFNVLELRVRQSCSGSSPLKLLEYRYGGIGFRGNRAWDGVGKARFLTSNGESDRVKAHASRVKWCYMGGEVNGAQAGIAVLAHPGNFRAPEPVRVHPDEPFLNFAPSQAGDFEIKPGQTYAANYRMLLLDGQPNSAQIDAAWADYALAPLKPLPQDP